jgi:Domain of unknown function (DUF5658)
MRSFVCIPFSLLLIGVLPAHAQDAASVPDLALAIPALSATSTRPAEPSWFPSACRFDDTCGIQSVAGLLAQTELPRLFRGQGTPPRRPAALIPLYLSFATLQALDVHSTLQALDQGGAESNPVVAGMVGTHGFPLMKAVTTTAIILATERFRKSHPRAAIAVMIAANSAYAVIVANNYGLAGRGRPEIRN